eukprot:GHVN01096409.1.p1 GENE.GHVN01096409.1~~GHVN01096409.1.p1  ORF type:complete len:968 (+),score=240.43 GHVN01096409.1:10-2913(+)
MLGKRDRHEEAMSDTQTPPTSLETQKMAATDEGEVSQVSGEGVSALTDWSDLTDALVNDTDLVYEQELLKNPWAVKIWLMYVDSLEALATPHRIVYVVYERALKVLPGSYKLWWRYLQARIKAVSSLCITSPEYDEVNSVFERALINLTRMPVIWLMYVEFLRKQKLITRTRRTFDRALRSLPITQHSRIWEEYVAFLKAADVPETSLKVFRRYLLLHPDHTEVYIAYLIGVHRFDEAAVKLSEVVNEEDFTSIENKTNHQLWMDLCDLITKRPNEIKSIDVEAVIRSGIVRYTDEVGRLWCSLGEHFVRLGQFEKARDVYEEGIGTVMTVHDFSLVFDAYSAFLEHHLTHYIAKSSEVKSRVTHLREVISSWGESDGEDSDEDEESEVRDSVRGAYRKSVLTLSDVDSEVDLSIARLDNLMTRRLELLSSVKLRQNPHSVNEWLNRVKLYEKKDPEKAVRTFSEAVLTVDPQRAVGKLHVLWIRFSQFYERHDDLENARLILEKATQVHFTSVDDLASIWCHWVEMELVWGETDRALAVARDSVVQRGRGRGEGDEKPWEHAREGGSIQSRLTRSVKLWSLCADVEEMFGTVDTVRAVYQRIMDCKVCTVSLVLSAAAYLEEMHFYEESFKVFEKAVELFRWPHLNTIWVVYLTKFITRYGGRKLERARELFEQALVEVPSRFARRLFIMYANLEEEFGLSRHCVAILARACKAVPESERLETYYLYLSKVSSLFGVIRTRPIYEEAIDALNSDSDIRDMCLRFANMERGVGEVDRVREIYKHASQYCNPVREGDFWREWREYEVSHGSEDSFRDMLRIKRSVQAQYTQVHFNAAELLVSEGVVTGEAGQTPHSLAAGVVAAAGGTAALDPMAAAEAEIRAEIEAKRLREVEEREQSEVRRRKEKEVMDVEVAAQEYAEHQARQGGGEKRDPERGGEMGEAEMAGETRERQGRAGDGNEEEVDIDV